MEKESSGNTTWFWFFLALLLFFSSISPNTDSEALILHDLYILEAKNKKNIFLELEENEIISRLGEPKNIVSEEKQTIYVYDGISLVCSDFTVVKIVLTNKDYTTLNRIKLGDKIFELKLLNGFIVPLFKRISFMYANKISSNENVNSRLNATIRFYSRDPFGRQPYVSGQRVDSDLPTYILTIEFVNREILSIILEKTSINYVDI